MTTGMHAFGILPWILKFAIRILPRKQLGAMESDDDRFVAVETNCA